MAVLLWKSALPFWLFAICVCIVSAVNGLFGKATDALLRSLVSVSAYPKARSINEGKDATVSLAGSPLGGLLYGLFPWLPFLVMGICHGLSAVSAVRIPSAQRTITGEPLKDNDRTSFVHDFLQGWMWTWRCRTLMLLVLVACLMNFGANGMQYAVQLHLVSKGVSPVLIGFIDSGAGIVILCGSLLAVRMSQHIKVGTGMIITLLFYSVCMIPLLFTDNYTVILVCSSLMFLPFPLFNALVMGFIFAKTPASLQGRVSTSVAVPSQLLSMFTSAISGILLPRIGFSITIARVVGSIIVALLITIAVPKIRTIPAANQWGTVTL